MSQPVSPVSEGKESPPRLFITHLEAENFKSYAGKKTIGPFQQKFTCIIGPNGSGKSNVIDAVLFVFGYRARKIRSKKLSVLIHKSAEFPNFRSCRVTVYFQQIRDVADDRYEVVPGSDFQVSRAAHHDNTSEYFLNGTKASYREVTELLRNYGIDLDHNRFLILQGEVESVALMKPKGQHEHDEGMLEFLEDIIGTADYKDTIEDLFKEYEELQNARGEKVNRLKFIEKELSQLESAKEEAEQFLKQRDRVALSKYKLFHKNLFELKTDKGGVDENLDALKVEITKIEEQSEEQSNLVKAKQHDLKKKGKVLDKMKEAEESKTASLTECERRDVKAREDQKIVKSNIKSFNKTLEKERQKFEDLQTAPERLKKQIEEGEKNKVKFEKSLSIEDQKLEQIMSGLREATRDLQQEKEQKASVLLQVKVMVNDAKSEQDMASTEYDLYMRHVRDHESQTKDKQFNLEDSQKKLQANTSLCQELKHKVPRQRKEIENFQIEIDQYTQIETTLAPKLEATQRQLVEGRSSLSAHKTRGKLLEGLMMAKEAGHITGIIGRLGDLASIDQKYDVAISTACPSLENILLDTGDTSVQCINFLKEHDLGRATFSILERMERNRFQAMKPFHGPENVPRLFDLLHIQNDAYIPAFYFITQDTLVANNLEEATKIGMGIETGGRKRYRVVTLSGDLVDKSGTMSGGGRQVSRGRMSASIQQEFSPVQIEVLEKDTAKLKHELEEYQKRKRSAESRISVLQTEVQENESRLQKASMDIDFCSAQCEVYKTQLNELMSNRVTVDPKEVERLERRYRECQDVYNQIHTQFSKSEAELEKLDERINAVGADKVDAQQKKINSVKKELDEVKSKISKANVGIASNERNIAKCSDQIESCIQDIKEAEDKKVSISEELSNLEQEVLRVMNQFENHIDGRDDIREEVEQIKSELTELTNSLNKQKCDLQDLKNEKEKLDSVMKQYRDKDKYYRDQLKKLKFDSTPPSPLTEEQLQEMVKEDLTTEISVEEERLSVMKPNLAAIEEYRKKEEVYKKRVEEVDKVTGDRDVKKKEYDDLRNRRLTEFMAGFIQITINLKEMYQMLTLGGDAELELVDTLDPFSEGIILSIRPPRKSWKNIKNLSGGEKTLSSLALIFALHQYKPSPLYIMDEIDAALDYRNVSLLGHYIKERTKNAQFIVVSLRNYMFDLADRLVGIYKIHDVTSCITITL